MMRLYEKLLLVVLISCSYIHTDAQGFKNQLIRNLNVADGLPQSVVTGIEQDSVGFIWIATRDGLARYDGKKYKIFRHIPADSASVLGNTIAELYMGAHNRLWLLYETGDIDIINTLTERIVHVTNIQTFRPLFKKIKIGHTIIEDGHGNGWLLGEDGVFVCNIERPQLKFYSYATLNLSDEKTASIVLDRGNIVIVSVLSLTRFSTNMDLIGKIPYPPLPAHLASAAPGFKNFYVLFRKNGDAIIQCNNTILIYQAADKSFVSRHLEEKDLTSNSMAKDENDNIYFFYTLNIWYLSLDNDLSLWKPAEQNPKFGFLCILFDRSGVLWLGTNGDGVQLFDLRLLRLQGIPYTMNFPKDIFNSYLHVDTKNSEALSEINNPFNFRCAYQNNTDVIFTRTDCDARKQPQVFIYKNNQVVAPSWHYNDTPTADHSPIYALAFSRSGQIWGINFLMQPVHFDTASNTATVYKSIAQVNTDGIVTTDLLMDGENKFWVTTGFDGLFFHDNQSNRTVHYTYSEKPGDLPTNQLAHIEQDASDSLTLWISSLGAGIIKFNKATGKCKFFTTYDGLPDNTVYAMVPDKNNMYWCSSNKGIFSFSPRTYKVPQSFTSKDGLAGDEFNRFHYFKFPDGDIAFGGVNGYVVFNPLAVQNDSYEPAVGLTAIEINNVAADFGQPKSPFKAAVNSLTEVGLPYDQNFLTFHFAALEYNIPDKIKYRFILKGFDDDFVYAGNTNIATYTRLPHGKYTFVVNATNTSGKWSNRFKTITVVIKPPFWQTGWFEGLIVAIAAGFVYWLIKHRVGIIRRQERQKFLFEQEASELKAQALRAQMNPHFIFNSLNSIKALIQEDKKQESVIYLTAFSKLMRNQLNITQQEISLHEELETCKLYVQLESLRFGESVSSEFTIDEKADMHSLMIPPLLLQPFVENAIWHGILPKGKGKVVVSVKREASAIVCQIDDDGIGREMAIQNKLKVSSTYESKGMQLVKSRLHLYNTISVNEASVEVIDKKDGNNSPTGTLIIIRFKQEL